MAFFLLWKNKSWLLFSIQLLHNEKGIKAFKLFFLKKRYNITLK